METSCIDLIIKAATPVVALGGIITAMRRWKVSLKQSRAEFVHKLTEKLRSDERIAEAINILDYDQEWYDEYFHESGNIERNVDHALSYFSHICYLKSNKLIKKKDFENFEYHITRAFNNKSTKNYLFNIHHFAEKNNCKSSFSYLIKYGRKKKLLKRNFKNKESQEYIKILNF